MSEAEHPDNVEEEQDERPVFRAENVKTHDGGRMTIPARHRNTFDLSENTVVNVRVETDDTVFEMLDVPLDAGGRVRIPRRKRRLYGVEDGELVDIDVMVTDMEMPDGE